MKRSHAFRPSAISRLEDRLALSQVYFSPQTGIIDAGKPVHAEVARPKALAEIHTASRTKLADGKMETTNISVIEAGAGTESATEVIHEPGGKSKTIRETATTSGNTRTISRSITLPDGAHQAETGTDVIQGSTTSILPDGTLQPNPGSDVIQSTAMTFDHVTTQPGVGTMTIQGTSYTQTLPGETITVTDQRETHSDGSQDEVKILAIKADGVTTTRETTIRADDSSTTSVTTSRQISSTAT